MTKIEANYGNLVSRCNSIFSLYLEAEDSFKELLILAGGEILSHIEDETRTLFLPCEDGMYSERYIVKGIALSDDKINVLYDSDIEGDNSVRPLSEFNISDKIYLIEEFAELFYNRQKNENN